MRMRVNMFGNHKVSTQIVLTWQWSLYRVIIILQRNAIPIKIVQKYFCLHIINLTRWNPMLSYQF